MRWFYLAIVLVFVAALIIFVFQNTQSVNISFLALGRHAAARRARLHRLCARRAERRQPLRASAAIGRRFAPRLKGAALMRAMVLHRAHERLAMEERPDPTPGPGQVRVRVEACGVCRTDLHVVDGELPNPKLPIVPGHEIVGRVDAIGEGVGLKPGARVGVAWLGHTDGTCPYCRSGRENLCDAPLFTGYTRDGGYATHAIADADFVFPLSEDLDPVADGAAALRRPDRLALAQAGGRRADDRHLRLRRRGAHHRPSLPLAGAARVRLHPAGRRGRSGLRALYRRRMGGRVG